MQSMPPLRQTVETATNPQAVLNGIGAQQGMNQGAAPSAPLHHDTVQDRLRIVRHEDEEIDHPAQAESYDERNGYDPLVGMSDVGMLHSTVESAKQIQQLAARLEQIKTNLVQREQAVEQKLGQWHQAVEKREQEYEVRLSQLHQQASQVRLQQQHVMQLQDDIVKSNEAAKIAISAIVTEHAQQQHPQELVQELTRLQHELDHRFNYIAKRWEQLHNLLEQQRVAIAGERAIDDRVWWGK